MHAHDILSQMSAQDDNANPTPVSTTVCYVFHDYLTNVVILITSSIAQGYVKCKYPLLE
jgi:hypothetical protein